MTIPEPRRPDDEPEPEHDQEAEHDQESEHDQEYVQRAWDAIVADLSGQVDLGPQFRPDPPVVEDRPHPDDVWLDEGYEPPEPPAIPRPHHPAAKAAWAGVIGGPIVFLLIRVLGWEAWLGWIAGAATIAGFVTLIARLPDHREDEGDGAIV